MLGGGGGIQSTILSMRLCAVHRDIASGRLPRQPLSAIAERRGVSDLRSFRRAFGYTPSDLRARSAGEATSAEWQHAEAVADIERWFEA